MDAQPVIADKLLSYWFLMQLYKGHATADHYLHFRAIANERPTVDPKTGRLLSKTKVTGSITVPMIGFKDAWMQDGGIFDQLNALNNNPDLPSNIYYAMSLRNRLEGALDKKSCIGFTSSFLDLDVTKIWSLEDRRNQLAFWAQTGFKPTLTVLSGHGIQAIWVWLTRIDAEIGEPILKQMVLYAGCRGGGNCFDVTRILRLPGFRNVKNWYDNDTPKCLLLDPTPDLVKESLETGLLLPRHDWEKFKNFPISGKDTLEEFSHQAVILGTNPAKEIAIAIGKVQAAEEIKAAVDLVHHAEAKPAFDRDKKKVSDDHVPIFSIVPIELDEIGIPKKDKKWFRVYCTKGWVGLTNNDILMLTEKMGNSQQLSASELDARVMYLLIKCRYTFEAIDAFWHRPTLRLFREDKEQRSPGYLRATYDKMLAYFLAAEEQKAQTKEKNICAKNTIFKDDSGRLCIVRSDKETEHLLTGDMEITERYTDMDEPVEEKQEYYRANVTDMSSNMNTWTVQRAAFNSVKALKQVARRNIFITAKYDADLQHLLSHLLIENREKVKEGRFHSLIKYIQEEHKLTFPYYTVSKDKIEFFNNADIVKLVNRQMTLTRSWLNTDPGRDRAYAEFSRVWPDMLRMHCPRFVISCIGSLVMSAMRQVFQKNKHVSINVPTFNFRGASCSGKTETLFQFYRVTGSTNPREQRLGASSTQFGISKMIEVCQTIPLVVDEFKEEDEGMGKNQHMMTLRRLVRTLFSGETIARGRADLSVSCQMLQALMWIAGESILERTGHLAELTRIFTIDTDNWDMGKSKNAFTRVKNSNIEFIGPYLYQYLLSKDIDEEYARFSELEQKYDKALEDHFGRLASRGATNIACIVYGVQLWDRFLQHVNKNLQKIAQHVDLEEEVLAHMIHHANQSGNIIRILHQGKTMIRERDEAWAFLDTLSKMVKNKDKAISELEDRFTPCYAVSPDKCYLFIYLPVAYDAYKQYNLRLQYQSFEAATIKARFAAAFRRHEEWIIDPEAVYAEPGRSPQLAVKLDLKILQGTGYWPLPPEPTLGGVGMNDCLADR